MKLILQKNISLSENDLKEIKNLGFSIEYYNNKKVEGDIYVGYPKVPFTELDNIKGLKFIQSLMAGFDHLDIKDIKDRNIVLANASGVSSIPIAEYVILKILDHYKNAQNFRDKQKLKEWGSRPDNEVGIKELYNRKAIVLGTGHIGKAIAKRLKAFEVSVTGFNRSGDAVDNFEETHSLNEVEKYLSNADVVIGCLPLNKATKGLYNNAFFKLMKKDSIFINVGRGPQVVEEDLLEVLNDHLAHVYLDVLPEEPLESSSKLWSHPKISITPHISASSDYIEKRIKDLIIENILNFKADKPVKNRIV